MFSTIKGAARIALAVSIFSVLGLTASAQVIRIGANAAAPLAPVPPASTCVATGTVIQSAFFDVELSNNQFDTWKIEGDYTLVGALTANPLQFRPTGNGKVRITAQYYSISIGNGFVTCPPAPPCPYQYEIRTFETKTAEYFKTFPNSAWSIKGPTCVPANNPSVVYSVDPAPISTIPQIQSGVGIDEYTWEVRYASSGTPLMNATFITKVGDGSAIIIAGDNPLTTLVEGGLTGSFTVKVQVGKCNPTTFKQIPVTVATPVASAITLNTLPCKPIGNASNAGFSIGNQNGVTYTLTTTGGLTVSPTSIASTAAPGVTPIVVSGITATNTGSVIVTAVGNTGTCFGSQTTVLPLTRALSTTNSITSATTCVPASTAGT
ncbi:MAG: hypothetical protein H7330_12010, partial [Hymenobacteraceae bacterium]|nr:hypothetical protein [Hymenobacteraceae bacterium]